MDTTTHKTRSMNIATRPAIIESTDYKDDAKRLLASPHIYDMFEALPAEVQQQLTTGEQIAGFIGAANAEWTRRNDADPQPLGAPRYIGTVERALRLVAVLELTSHRA